MFFQFIERERDYICVQYTELDHGDIISNIIDYIYIYVISCNIILWNDSE